jgi:hypothetical protein
MLFQIGESVSHLFCNTNFSQHDLMCLRYLAMGAAEGNHRITGHRKVLKALAEVQLGDLRLSNAFTRAAERVATEGALVTRLQCVAKIEADGDVPRSETIGGRRSIIFPLHWFDSSARIQPTYLLAENLDDVAVLRRMGMVGAILASYKYHPLSIAELNGGGSSIAAVLTSLSNQDRLCICVADSDKQCPSSPEGQTARGLIPYENELAFPLIQVLKTTGRDLENCLPDFFYADEYGRHHAYASIANFLRQLTEQQEYEVRNHVDIEKGFRLFELLGSPLQSAERLFWDSKLTLIFNLADVLPGHFPCVSSQTCARGSKDLCQCIVVTGNPSHILRTFNERYGLGDAFNIAPRIEASVKPEWERMGTTVFSWCCGDTRIRV